MADTIAIHRPWRIDYDNESGVAVVDDLGNLVHSCDYGDIPTERGAAFFEQIVKLERANAHAMVNCVNDAICRSKVIEALRSASNDAAKRPDITATRALSDIADLFERNRSH